jgi:hypothetical protein
MIEAMKLALEALKFGLHVGFDESSESQIKKGGKAFDQHSKAITALRTAIEAAEKQEPVAWAVFEGWNAHDLYLPQEYDEALKMAGYKGDHAEVKPLYTHPSAAQREPAPGYCKHCKQYTIEEPLPAAQRQPLTDEEIMQTWEGVIKYAPGEVRLKDFARAIEAAHGIGEKK